MPLKRVVLLLVLACFVPLLAVAETPGCGDEAEMRAEVRELSSFHDVIYPLWHEAWPSKNVQMMQELLPQVRERVAAVKQATLPGILRDKAEAWAAGVKALDATLAAYEQAA
ncbi:MAG: hypothetical protein V1750_03115, partial [Acidobacteriota bacterium]